MSTVVFDYDEFLIMFPHINEAVTEGKLTEATITATFDSVASWLKADDSSLYPYDPANGEYTRKTLLYLATCHLLSIDLWGNGQSGCRQRPAPWHGPPLPCHAFRRTASPGLHRGQRWRGCLRQKPAHRFHQPESDPESHFPWRLCCAKNS